MGGYRQSQASAAGCGPSGSGGALRTAGFAGSESAQWGPRQHGGSRWGLLFGDDFRRDQTAGGINALLNYGYTVLRATTARSVVAAGLHPSIGLHHSNDANAMRLVDDLMEPFRPMVDFQVKQLAQQGKTEVNDETKRSLALVMFQDMQTAAGATPVMVCTQKLAVSLAQVYLGERQGLELPLRSLPLDFSAMRSSDG